MLGMRRPFTDMGQSIVHQFGLGRGRPLDQFDINAGHFARMGIGLANRPGKSHILVARQSLLDLGGIDVMAAANDQILGPAGDPQITVRIDPAQIAGAQILRAFAGERIVQVLVLVRVGIGLAPDDPGG